MDTDLTPGSDSYRFPRGIRSIAARFAASPGSASLARHHVMGASVVPPTSRQRRESFARRASPAALFVSNALRARAPAVNLPTAVSLNGERGCASHPIARAHRGGAVDTAMERAQTNGIGSCGRLSQATLVCFCRADGGDNHHCRREHFDSG